MIRNYNRKLAGKKNDIDVLNKLKAATAEATAAYIPTKIPKFEYDESAITNATTSLTERIENATKKTAQSVISSTTKKVKSADKTALKLQKGIDTGDTSDSNLLAMIFKIIPVGINVVKKSNTMLTGLKESVMGLVNLVKNVAILTAIYTIDTIQFISQLMYYLFKLMICAVANLGNIHKCILFYLFDVFIFILTVCIISFLFLIDMIFMVKKLTGISCVEIFTMLPKLIETIDDFIYSYVSIHVFQYPAPIIKMCYTCSAMGDTSGFKSAFSEWFNVTFIRIPNEIGGPIGDIFTGIGHFFSFFNFD
jgi:hypothetical protein